MDNRAHSGKVTISLQNRASIKECKDPNVTGRGEWLVVRGDIYLPAASFILIAFDPFYFCPLFSAENYAQEFFDVLVAIVCVLSLLLCGRSILRGILLQHVRKLANNFCIFLFLWC